jgi:hypothetical protein
MVKSATPRKDGNAAKTREHSGHRSESPDGRKNLDVSRNPGFLTRDHPEISSRVVEALRDAFPAFDIKEDDLNIRRAISEYLKNKKIDAMQQRMTNDFKGRKLHRAAESLNAEISGSADQYSTAVMERLRRAEGIAPNEVAHLLGALLRASEYVCKLGVNNGTRLADVACDIAAVHLIRAWEQISNSRFRFSLGRGWGHGEKEQFFVADGMRFLQVAFAAIDKKVKPSRIKLAAEKVSAARSVKKKVV